MKPQLLADAEPYADVRGWLCAEKLDGFRAILRDGTLWSREGHDFQAPAWWLGRLPQGIVLDGELYHSRRGGLSALKSAFMLGEWQQLTLRVFDAPLAAGGFAERLRVAERACQGTSAIPVPHVTVRDLSHAWQLADAFIALGGEGAVLRDPSAPYAAGRRVRTALKLKRVDKGALVNALRQRPVRRLAVSQAA